MSILDTLVTDRIPGACYGWQDMNRVGEAMQYLSERLRAAGYGLPADIRTDFTREDFPTPAVFDAYTGQLRRLRNMLAPFATTPPVPEVGSTKDYMTYGEANDIERILLDVDRLISSLGSAVRRCGGPGGGMTGGRIQ